MPDKKKLFIIIPTYNEKENILKILNEIGNLDLETDTNIIIVDDNSPDNTGELVKLNKPIIEDKYSIKIHLIEREGKLGLGSAYITGMKKALNLNADYIMEMDADFSHQPKYIPIFIETVMNEKVDAVIGSRYIRGGKVENWGVIRKFISKGGSIYARTILGMKVQDMTGGYNLYKSEVLESINLDGIKSNGYSFQIEIKYRAFKKGFVLKEIPIIFPDRTEGQSKMSKKIFLEAVRMVWSIKFKKI